jgi:hypothetical protein
VFQKIAYFVTSDDADVPVTVSHDVDVVVGTQSRSQVILVSDDQINCAQLNVPPVAAITG